MMHFLYPFVLFMLCAGLLSAQCPTLVWSDEFDGTTLDLDNWSYEIGDGCDRNLCGWGNNELQYYQEDNAVVSDGTLKITARRESVGGRDYTSARLISRDKQDFKYGRMEARIKVPAGQGTWPAFWMLPTDEVYGFWPQSGEIDIMEYVGREPNQVIGTIHYGQPWPNNRYNTGSIELNQPVADDFHEFAIEWEEGLIRWFFDGILYHTQRPEDLNGENWPFDEDFFFILNQAVGGNLGGAVDPSAYPATFEVDYVRVYAGSRPYISGERNLDSGARNVAYAIGNVADDTAVEWIVPDGATITAGRGTPQVTIDWSAPGGTVTAIVPTECGSDTLSVEVEVAPPYVYSRSLENFDEPGELEFEFATGTLTEVGNPDSDSINSSATVGRYVRAAGSQFDVLVYNVSTITDANLFSEGTQRFYIDVYTDAPVGTEILLQLETAASVEGPYPIGRHSRYQGFTTEQNAWQRIHLAVLDRPDTNADPMAVDKLILLMAPNSNNGSTYFIDNLDVYVAETTGLFSPAEADFPLTASPNPVSDRLRLRATLPVAAQVRVEVFTLSGRLIATSDYGFQPAGAVTLPLSVADLPTGLYLARLSAGERAATVRFVR